MTTMIRAVAALLAVVISMAGASTLRAQAALPDWSGAWIFPFESFAIENSRSRILGDPMAPPLTPAYVALMAETRRGLQGRADASVVPGAPTNGPRRRLNSEDCLPTGTPNIMRYSFAFEFLFTPGRVTIILEHDDTSVRRIYTDGRPHTDDPDPSYNGESIGHWEGETLVVHTAGISSKAELIAGVPTSGRATVTESIHLIAADRLQIDTVIEDPVALSKPWKVTRVYTRTTPVFFERVCQENNREGRGDMPDLTPPKP
jgi:hypothetical protein